MLHKLTAVINQHTLSCNNSNENMRDSTKQFSQDSQPSTTVLLSQADSQQTMVHQQTSSVSSLRSLLLTFCQKQLPFQSLGTVFQQLSPKQYFDKHQQQLLRAFQPDSSCQQSLLSHVYSPQIFQLVCLIIQARAWSGHQGVSLAQKLVQTLEFFEPRQKLMVSQNIKYISKNLYQEHQNSENKKQFALLLNKLWPKYLVSYIFKCSLKWNAIGIIFADNILSYLYFSLKYFIQVQLESGLGDQGQARSLLFKEAKGLLECAEIFFAASDQQSQHQLVRIMALLLKEFKQQLQVYLRTQKLLPILVQAVQAKPNSVLVQPVFELLKVIIGLNPLSQSMLSLIFAKVKEGSQLLRVNYIGLLIDPRIRQSLSQTWEQRFQLAVGEKMKHYSEYLCGVEPVRKSKWARQKQQKRMAMIRKQEQKQKGLPQRKRVVVEQQIVLLQIMGL